MGQFLLFLTLISFHSINAVAFSSGELGEIRASILSEEQFIETNGKGWVLMDGRLLDEESPLRKITGLVQIPDARGQFLRMKSYGDNGVADYAIGSRVAYSTALPRSNNFLTNSMGDHTHNIVADPGESVGIGYLAGYNDGDPSYAVGEGRSQFSVLPRTVYIPGHNHTMIPAGSHFHKVTSGGDEETAPRHLVVNFFIKVDNGMMRFIGDRLLPEECPSYELTNEISPKKAIYAMNCHYNRLRDWEEGKLILPKNMIKFSVNQIISLEEMMQPNFTDEEKDYWEKRVLTINQKYIKN